MHIELPTAQALTGVADPSHLEPAPWRRFIATVVRTHRALVLKTGVLLILASSTDPIIPWSTKILVDGAASGFPMAWVPAIVLLALVGKCVASCLAVHSVALLSSALMMAFQAPLLRRLFDTRNGGGEESHRILDLLTFEMRHLTEFIDRFSSRFIKNLCTFCFLMASLAWTAPTYVLAVVVALGPFVLILAWLGARAWHIGLGQQRESQRLIGRVSDSDLPCGQLGEQLAAQSFTGIRRLSMRYYDINALAPNFTQALLALLFGLIILYASQGYQQNGLSKGEFVGFVTTLLMLMGPLKYIAELTAPIGRGLANIYLLLFYVGELPDRAQEQHKLALGFQFAGLDYAIPYSTRSLRVDVIHLVPGMHTAVVGASGEGKSTLLEIMLGQRPPGAPADMLNGPATGPADLHLAAADLMYLRQDEEAIPTAYLSSLSLFTVDEDEDRAREALCILGLPALADALTGPEDRARLTALCTRLTHAERQRLLMAEAYFSDCLTYVLDEPLSALERSERVALIARFLLHKRGATVVFTSHTLPPQLAVDAVLYVAEGRVTQRRPVNSAALRPVRKDHA